MGHTFIAAEVGINHNGDMAIAKRLIDLAAIAGCDAVKFQKRTVDKVYTKEYLDGYRESPWGTTQRQQKEGLEFGLGDYQEIDRYCKEKQIAWFASAWDIDSQKFLQIAKERKYTFIATGMSTYNEIDHAVKIFRKHNCEFELMHCNSTYPMKEEDANLSLIPVLRERYGCQVGYSGHEAGTLVSSVAVSMGASSIERHITLDKGMYGSDQKASIEPAELCELVRNIRSIEKIMGIGEKVLSEAELEVKAKLRG